MLYLRRKIDRPFGVEQLETVRGAGYRLRGEPAVAADASPDRQQRRSRMPLRMRLALLFALATAVALAVAGLAFVRSCR